MGKLNKSRVYLSGSIDFAADDGISWRQEIQQKLDGLGITFFDPTNKPQYMTSEVKYEKHMINELKQGEKWEELSAFVKKFVREDLRLVDLSDVLIAYIDTDIFSFGTIHEVVIANVQKKPILCIAPRGKKNLSSWAFGLIKHEEIFDTINECVEYIKKIDSGEVATNDRWVLINQYLK